MFFSLNKKFLYTIAIFFLFTAIIFLYTFYIVYGNKIQEEQKSTILRNQQYLELLYENINLRKELHNYSIAQNGNTGIEQNNYITIVRSLKDKQEELTREQQRTAQIVQNYDERYQAIHEGIRIVIASSFLIVLSMLLIWYLMQRWVLNPINKLAGISRKVSSGDFSIRVNLMEKHTFLDELDDLSITFNQMLDNIENNIKKIKSQETFLQSIIDSIPDGIRVIDDEGNIIIANQEYYRQIGSNENCIAQKCYKSSQDRNSLCPRSMFTCPLHEIKVNKAKNVKVIQQFSKFPNRHLAINAAPLFLDNKKLYIVEAIRDLSEDIRFSHQQKLSSLGFLATSVAHEMKNHLGSIRMIIEGILDKYYQDKDNEEKKYLTLINDQIVACTKVPERLLKLAQFSSEEKQDIDCISSINDVLALLDYEAKRNGVDIKFNYNADNIHISGSDSDFKMALINLIQNAFKAMPNGGNLQIDLNKNEQHIVSIEITDNGVGIKSDKINRIFEPFYSDGTNSRGRGTGLGLSIVKSIVENFNATIDVSSEEHKFTRFTLRFPRTDKK